VLRRQLACRLPYDDLEVMFDLFVRPREAILAKQKPLNETRFLSKVLEKRGLSTSLSIPKVQVRFCLQGLTKAMAMKRDTVSRIKDNIFCQ
jgi:hypothetical protein